MKIWTGYYGAVNHYLNNAPGIMCIAISGKAPEGWNYPHYPKLAPSYDIWKEWHNSTDSNKNNRYTERFNNEILAKLDPNEVINDLSKLTFQENIVLCCYEKPMTFCHRHLVAHWLHNKLNMDIFELPKL